MDKGIVDAQAAVFPQQLVRVGVDLGRGVALYPDVSGQAIAVLAFGAAVAINVRRSHMCYTLLQ